MCVWVYLELDCQGACYDRAETALKMSAVTGLTMQAIDKFVVVSGTVQETSTIINTLADAAEPRGERIRSIECPDLGAGHWN